MITLFTFGRKFGLPDPSPFVVKAEILLKMAKIPYEMDTNGFRKAPKGKIPYILENGKRLGDSTFIRFHLEQRHSADFNKSLSKEEQAIGWAFEKLCEDHLYWAMLDMRWLVDANFNIGPAVFFQSVPGLIRPFITKMIRGKIRKGLHSQGFGRHTRAEIEQLAIRDIEAIATYLGDKTYFMGDQPTGFDATIFAFVSGILCPHFQGPLRVAAERHTNLRAYSERMMRQYFPELAAGEGVRNHSPETMRAASMN